MNPIFTVWAVAVPMTSTIALTMVTPVAIALIVLLMEPSLGSSSLSRGLADFAGPGGLTSREKWRNNPRALRIRHEPHRRMIDGEFRHRGRGLATARQLGSPAQVPA